MNAYQKSGIFIARIVGTVMVVVAVAGLGYYVVLAVRGDTSSIPGYKVGASILWLVFGSVLVAVSKPLGQFWGSDLG
jgi:hypothetical protein